VGILSQAVLADEITPKGYSYGTLTTYVKDAYGNTVGEELHVF
jgi:hypothetical protein